MVENMMRDRIRARLEALDLNPFEAARLIPAERTFLNDLLIGKKETIRAAAIPKVAAALQCDPGYLIGAQNLPRQDRPPDMSAAGKTAPDLTPASLHLAGIIEAGAWRAHPLQVAAHELPLAPDPRFPYALQSAFLVRGDHASELGATDGSVILAVAGKALRDGDVAVVKRSRDGEDGPEAELSLRRVKDGYLEPISGAGKAVSLNAQGVEVLARAVSSHKTF